ncbi:phage tail protein [Escherichia coli]|nr:phage tail protein [Escherichia coli]
MPGLAVPRRLIRERIRLQRASADRVYAKVIINTGNLPAIKLGTTRAAFPQKATKERRAFGHERRWQRADCGKRRIPDAFITRLANGRWHVMQRMPWASSSTGADSKGGRNATVCRSKW